MNFRRFMQCGSVSFLLVLSLPQAALAVDDDGRPQSPATQDCNEADHRDADGHDAGERDREHEHAYSTEVERDDDCEIAPPVEVAEAPKVMLLSASAVVTGGAAVLIIRRRSRAPRTAEA